VTKASVESAGTLYIVATPIGNLADLSPRASEVLGQCALIAAEDTRRTGALLQRVGINVRLVSLHEHNEAAQTSRLLELLDSGQDLAVVSDAGTPLISDPGLRLVAAAAAQGIVVTPVPGPSAVTAALSVSGLATDRFVFEGFLPRRAGKRRTRLAELAGETRTLVFFEAVHRIREAIADMCAAFGPSRRAVVARELTKLHEQIVRAPLGELVSKLGEEVPLLGEFVVVVAGAEADEAGDPHEIRRVFGLLAETMSRGEAVALCARITGRPRNEVYDLTRAGSG
jgi:16S rRNA (cytidine1402-2'-O)-methyltransferase